MHAATRSIDHLRELLVVLGKGSRLEELKLHRTKCSILIINAIGQSILHDITDLGSVTHL